MSTAGTSRRYLHDDHQGSIIAIADQSGNEFAVNAYDEYGIPNLGNQGRFGYTGQAWIPELGMWYYKARMYSPTLGRFMQTDPIGYGAGMNSYGYVGADPINWADSTGLKPSSPPPPPDPDPGQIIINGVRSVCREGYIAVGSVCVAGIDLNSIIVIGNKFSFVTLGKPYIEPGVDCSAKGKVVTCTLPPPPDKCGGGPRLNFGVGFSATLFVGVGGASAGVNGQASIPWSSLYRLKLKGLQFVGSVYGTVLAGFGAFFGFGNNYTLGNRTHAAKSGWSGNYDVQFGVGDGGGAEIAGTILSHDLGESISAGPRGAYGAYGAIGRTWSRDITFDIGC